MSPSNADNLAPLVNALLDALKCQYKATSDHALGEVLGVSANTIVKWRKGVIGKSARTLLPPALSYRTAINVPYGKLRRRRGRVPV